ncbi:MAG: hypothetical protein ABSF29_01560 [Tepidisphaeraceae bacterium]
MAVIAGMLLQKNLNLQQTESQQSQTIDDQARKLSDEQAAVAQTDQLKVQLAAAQSDASQAHAAVNSLQNQITGNSSQFSAQIAARDQSITQDRAQLQQQQAQIQQLTAACNADAAEIDQMKSKYGIAMDELQQPMTPAVSPISPSNLVYATHSVVVAASVEASTFAQFQAASDRVNEIAATLQNQFQATPQYTQAQSDLDSAKAAYDSARTAVISGLQSSSDYTAAVDARKTAQQAVEDAHQQGADGDQLAVVAQNSLAAMTAVTDLETAALAANSDFQDAKSKLTVAKANLNQLDQQFQNLLADNRAYQQAKLDYATATANHAAAMANLQALDSQAADRAAALRQAELQAQLHNWHDQNQNAEQQQNNADAHR